MKRYQVLMLPGNVEPGGLAYRSLLKVLRSDVDAVAKDMEVCAGSEPSSDYSLDTEVDGVLREADTQGWERFHLVGYSGGGAAALALTARCPERLWSLALLEPAWAGNWGWSPAQVALRAEYDHLAALPPDQFLSAFMHLGVKPQVRLPPPPPDEPPEWTAKRAAGIKAFFRTFKTYDLDRDALGHFRQPVYFALGGLTDPNAYGETATRLATVFPDFQLEVFAERHHFDPPHRTEPERLARSLHATWTRAQPGHIRDD
jgi:pimeloyl-ACP methyl ester carboxylesterase